MGKDMGYGKFINKRRKTMKYVYALTQVFYSGHEENLGLYSTKEYAETEQKLEESKYHHGCDYLIRKMRIIK